MFEAVFFYKTKIYYGKHQIKKFWHSYWFEYQTTTYYTFRLIISNSVSKNQSLIPRT